MTGSNILVGVILLLFGRRLFWLFVGAAGFIAGLTLTRDLLGPQPDAVVLAVALVMGLLGAVLWVVLQRVAIALAGFVVGGYVVATLVLSAGYPIDGWIPYVVGGIVGALLVVTLFDYALVVLSSLAGATLLAQSLGRDQAFSALVFVGAVIVGVIAQLAQLRTPSGRSV